MSAEESSRNPRMNQRPNQGRPIIFVLDRLVAEDVTGAPSSPKYAAKAYLERLLNSRLAECGRLGPIYLNIEGQGVFRMFPSRAGDIDFNNLKTKQFQRLLRGLFLRGNISMGGTAVIRKIKQDLSDLFSGFTVIGCVSGKDLDHFTEMEDYVFAPDKTYVFVIGRLRGGGIGNLITEYLRALDCPITSAEAFAGWVCDELEERWNL